MKKLFILLWITFIGFAVADPQAVYSTIDPEEVRSRISQLKEFRNNERLSDQEKEKLDNLWYQASKIEQMNDRCGSIDLTELLDDDCGYFYQHELPQFERDFFEVTGEIRLSSNRLSNAINNKRYAIEQCYEALQIESFHPTRFYELNGHYTPEPLSKGFEVSYEFGLHPNRDVLNDIDQRLNSWIKACGEYIMHSDNSGALAPLFVEKISQSKKNAGNTSGGLYFELQNNRTIVVQSNRDFTGTYYLNGKTLFRHNIARGHPLFRIYFRKKSANVELIDYGNSWRDKVVFRDSDESKGLAGRFKWSESSNTFNSSPSKSSGSTKSSESFESSQDDGLGLAFQLFGSLNLSEKPATGEIGEKFSVFSTDEKDSITYLSGSVAAMLFLEFNRNIAIGFGGGISWNTITIKDNDYYSESEEYNLYRSYCQPMAVAEIDFGLDIDVGVRASYIFDPEVPTLYLGGFLGLLNLFGVEMGWINANGLWNSFYVGFFLRLPPRHFVDRINEISTKK